MIFDKDYVNNVLIDKVDDRFKKIKMNKSDPSKYQSLESIEERFKMISNTIEFDVSGEFKLAVNGRVVNISKEFYKTTASLLRFQPYNEVEHRVKAMFVKYFIAVISGRKINYKLPDIASKRFTTTYNAFLKHIMACKEYRDSNEVWEDIRC